MIEFLTLNEACGFVKRGQKLSVGDFRSFPARDSKHASFGQQPQPRLL